MYTHTRLFLDVCTGDIVTSYDVVNYYTSRGHAATKKLFYLNMRAKTHPDEVRSPFDLVVVPYEKVQSEYWTMSAMGVVHVEADNEGEFVSLGEWMRWVASVCCIRMKGAAGDMTFTPGMSKVDECVALLAVHAPGRYTQLRSRGNRGSWRTCTWTMRAHLRPRECTE